MSKSKIRAIIKRPDEKYGHIANISCTLENLQKTVGGKIETVYLGSGIIMIINEEGKLLNLEPNFYIAGSIMDVIVGTAIVVGEDGEDFADCPPELETWKKWLKRWGN